MPEWQTRCGKQYRSDDRDPCHGYAARALSSPIAIDWQYAPFTRCLVDNRALEVAAPQLARLVPENSRAAGGPLRVCPECGRLFWRGGHVRRMQQRLAVWQQEATPTEQ